MEQRRSRPIAAEPERTRVLSPAALAGVIVMVIIALVLLFPRKTLIEQVANEPGNDQLTLNYLENLLRTDPRNTDLRLMLVEKKLAAGQAVEARSLLEPLKNDPAPSTRRRALMIEYRFNETQAYSGPKEDGARDHALAALRVALASISGEEWESTDLTVLVRSAIKLRDIRTADRLMARLAKSNTPILLSWLEESATSALADSDYRGAAAMYFVARQRALTEQSRRDFFLKGVAALQSGNLLEEALAAAERHLGDLESDEQTLAALTRLALAAGKPAVAQRYVKRMLRISVAPLFDWLAWFISSAHAAGTLREYDEQIYTLAYDVFLANANLADAYRVARAAVEKTGAPNWRERLAQVAEWLGKPQEALEQWLWLARASRADKAVQAVLRLAPGLYDYDALIYAWTETIARRRLSVTEWRDLAAIYELAGRPQDGMALLSEHAAREPAVLEPLAALYEHSGLTDEAIRTYERMLAGATPTIAQAVKLASFYFVKADFQGAWRVLAPLRFQTGETKSNDYWRTLAELAWLMQEDEAATLAYRTLFAGAAAEPGDAERLVQLLRQRAPEEAARVAAASWRKLPNPSLLVVAMDIYTEQRDIASLKRLFDTLSTNEHATLSRDADFLSARARYREATGARGLALADYRAALALAPANANLRRAVIYAAMAADDLKALRETLVLVENEARDDAAYWDAFAAAHITLGDSRRALAYFSRQASSRARDYLWLVNYADVLEQEGQGGMAWRVRHHAWDLARAERSRHAAPGPTAGAGMDHERMRAHARLVTQFSPGDASLAVIRSLLRQGASESGNAGLDAGVTELALAWAISSDQDEAAKAWLWTRYGKKLAIPAYAEVSVALMQNDIDTLERLLAEKSGQLPRYNRIDAARATQQLRLAQEMGFAEQEKRPGDDEIHLRLETDLLKTPNSALAQDKLIQRGVLKGREQSAGAQVWLSPKLRISTELVSIRQSSQDSTQLTGVPGTDRRLDLSLLYRHPDGAETKLSLGQRSALSQFSSWRIGHTRAFGNRLSGDFTMAQREYATESVPLSIGGHRDIASANLTYAFSKREFLRARVFDARYHTQQDTYVGSGRGYDWEAGYRIRTEYPDWTLRFSQIRQIFSQAETSDAKSAQLTPGGTVPPGSFFVPVSARTYALNAGFGDYFRENYGRAFRPFANLGRSFNDVTGNGYNWIVGAGGSVAGHDYFSLYWTRGKGGPGAGDATRELGSRYQYFF